MIKKLIFIVSTLSLCLSSTFCGYKQYLATASTDGTINIYNINQLKNKKPRKKTLKETEAFTDIAFSPDGKYLASILYDSRIIIFKTEEDFKKLTLQKIKNKKENLNFDRPCLAFSPDSKYLVTCDGNNKIIIWKTTNFAKPHPKIYKTFKEKNVETFSPLKFTKTKKKYSLASGFDILRGFTLSAKIQMWETNKWKPFFTLNVIEGSSILSMAFSYNGKYLAIGLSNSKIKILDLSDLKPITTLEGHNRGVASVEFSHDSKYLASGSKDRTTKIWDTETWTLITTLKKHKKGVTSVAFSIDDQYLATGSRDETTKIWEKGEKKTWRGKKTPQKTWKKPKLINTLKNHTDDVTSVVFSPKIYPLKEKEMREKDITERIGFISEKL